MCCDLSLCYHSEGSLSACLFDRASNFSANSFSWGDLLALHCWSHVQQILKWSHMSTFICVWVWVCVCVCARACMRVCLPMWKSKEVVSLQFCACGAHQELDATADILFPIWSPDSSENSAQSLIYNVWPSLAKVIFIWTGRGNGCCHVNLSRFLLSFFYKEFFTSMMLFSLLKLSSIE